MPCAHCGHRLGHPGGHIDGDGAPDIDGCRAAIPGAADGTVQRCPCKDFDH
jgi:hypothetical protein